MAEPFAGVAEKLKRGTDQVKTLRDEMNGFLTSDANGAVNDFDSEPGYLIVKAFSHGEPPPICGVLIGEFLYHYRSSLNHVACELTEANHQSVNDDTEFPIFDDGNKFRNPISGLLTRPIRDRIGGIDPAKQAIIEREQPFKGLFGSPHDDPLWILHDLANFDRHKAVHPVAAFTDESIIDFNPPSAKSRFILQSLTYGTVEGEAEVARYAIIGGPATDVKVDTQIRFQVAFSKSGPGGGRPLYRTLGDIGLRVAKLTELLAK